MLKTQLLVNPYSKVSAKLAIFALNSLNLTSRLYGLDEPGKTLGTLRNIPADNFVEI